MDTDVKVEVVILVVLEMCMSLLGIVCNLLIVATVRQDETLRATTLNFLLFNLCFSNLLIAFFVKPISAIYTGYAMSTDEWQVNLIVLTLFCKIIFLQSLFLIHINGYCLFLNRLVLHFVHSIHSRIELHGVSFLLP